jgi:hypothetical protein
MKKRIFQILAISISALLNLHSQQFSYTWEPTSTKIDISITYSADSSVTFITRQVIATHSYPTIESAYNIEFIGENINYQQNKVVLPLYDKLYVLVPFDPSVNGLTRLNYFYPDIDTLSIMLGSHDTLGLQMIAPRSGDIYWCSCKMSTEDPGGCLATLETGPGGRYSRCINDANCDNCVGWLGSLSSLIEEEGGGVIIEIKDTYGQNIYIE